ncbi:tyrosine/serine phosphatase-like protein [Stachybotrys elegans]|uniref:Tyrosine/serine phosphatase-like protein n=1 Tax=Stachybotrys elegans TaxID=80388 RepID=A0A8K0WLB9_9HYPO|nr:tyrosine/serine phosphatase-like protein [Stachybotrys elegans]
MALPSPPFVAVPGIFNFRDIGGYPVASRPGFLLRPGLVFRSGDPSAVTPDGLALLRDRLGLAAVFDLRSHAEVQRSEHLVPAGLAALRRPVPVFPERDYGPEAIAVRFSQYASEDGVAGFLAANRAILDTGTESFRAVMLHLAAEDPRPLLVNCTAGKDRTGVTCALILSLCGVADHLVAHDYGLTELGLAEKKEEFLDRLQMMPRFKDDREGARRMLGSRPENIHALLDSIRKDYGSVEEYLMTKCRLTAQEIDSIRRNLVVEASSVGDVALPEAPAS